MNYTISDMFGISGKTAVIAGAAGGMGKEIAKAFMLLGVKLTLADVDSERLKEMEGELKKDTEDVIAIQMDITNKESVQAMAKTSYEHFGHIDILVNCAGLSYLEDAVSFDEDSWDRLMAVNVKGTFLTCQSVGKYMLKQKRGSIVNFSSVRGIQGRARDLAYAPSKGAVNQLTRSLAIEWARQGINVNAIAPTWVLTEMNRDMLNDEKIFEWVLSRIPKGKLSIVENIIGPLVFLCSPCADFITGQIIYVDGGWTAS